MKCPNCDNKKSFKVEKWSNKPYFLGYTLECELIDGIVCGEHESSKHYCPYGEIKNPQNLSHEKLIEYRKLQEKVKI